MSAIKPIKWAEGYFVSSDGVIFSQKSQFRKNKTDLIPKICRGSSEYARVVLRVNGKSTSPLLVHRIVAETFVENPYGHKIVNHKNGNKRDNRAENLEWVTHLGNVIHARRNNLVKPKLTEEQVLEIRKLKENGATHKEVADAYGIDQSHVSLIQNRKRYAWLK